MDPSHLASMVQAAGGAMVGGIFYGGDFGLSAVVEHHLNAL